MTARLFALLNISFSCSIWLKRGLTLTLIAASFSAQSAPAEMGSITVTSSNASTGTASGIYIAAGSGATGRFTLVRNENIGYNSNAEITPSSGTRTNGIEIRNDSNTSIDRDQFEYTFTITPNDNASIHTIKIGQASYSMGGNSEIARQTLSFTQNSQISLPAQATIKNNPNVPYYYNAMGDYFMGTKLNATQLNSQNAVFNPQLRTDSSNVNGSGLYYYNITNLAGATGSQNPYTPTLNTNKQVSLNSNNGVLPPTPTFENIIKSINNDSTYSALSPNTAISNGGTYVSYGIENSQSNYVVAVRNANAVTLTYEGIMNGNIGIARNVVGETFNEWISFGVESEPLNYVFSGTVFNDNGGIYNNTNFFNGTFDSAESGIAGSTVKLVDCTTNAPLETINIPTNIVGKYEIKIPIASLTGKSTVCLIEENSGSTYPIHTTNEKTVISLTTNQYNYENNYFGRVIDKNAALVLEKEQALNDCKIASLLPNLENKLAYSKAALSEVIPGQCIAYKITATNRANLSINNFVLQDVLQEKNVNGAIVTSKLANPIHQASEYAADSVAIGNNGTVKTVTSILDPRTKRSFYFNTKYGTTHSNTPDTP
ncbi:hypothetical protein ACI2JM_05915 [Psychrobacter sp. NPDC064578]|uniref:hypothetical protein n=1 Tax=Psychrobacter sp. NPDC064578 TaxID=3364493 RepID=UPI00384E93DA